jgi:hypothetical protein
MMLSELLLRLAWVQALTALCVLAQLKFTLDSEAETLDSGAHVSPNKHEHCAASQLSGQSYSFVTR